MSSSTPSVPYGALQLDMRVALARRLGDQVGKTEATEAELKIARDLIANMISDAAVQVRRALVETLKHNPEAPRDAVLALSKDVDDVAAPMIQISEVLTPDDLIEILDATPGFAKMAAIAKRHRLPAKVSTAICERADSNIVEILFNNESAEIPVPAYTRAVERFGDVEPIQFSLMKRGTVPPIVIGRIMQRLSADLRDRLVAQGGLSPEAASAIVLNTTERASIGLTTGMSDAELERVIQLMLDAGKLTDTMILRAICTANIQFFEHAIAMRAKRTISVVRTIMNTRDRIQVERLLGYTGISSRYLGFLSAALDILWHSEAEAEKWDVGEYRTHVMERIVSICDFYDIDIMPDDLDSIFNAGTTAAA